MHFRIASCQGLANFFAVFEGINDPFAIKNIGLMQISRCIALSLPQLRHPPKPQIAPLPLAALSDEWITHGHNGSEIELVCQ